MDSARTHTTKAISVVLLSFAAAATVLAALIAATGGFTLDVNGIPISMHSVTRPVVVALALRLLCVFALGRDARSDGDRFYVIVGRDAWVIAGTFALVIAVATFHGSAR